MIKYIILLAVGVWFVLAGVFKWYMILAFFTWRFKPKSDDGIYIIRIVAVITGLLLIIGALYGMVVL